MKPEAQIIAIAEHLGYWKNCRIIPGQHGDWDEVVGIPHIEGDIWGDEEESVWTDYTRDLNACHEFEMALKEGDPHTYSCYLAELFEEHGCEAISLPPEARCKMYLQIINKWEENGA